jgi:hypothetical protein
VTEAERVDIGHGKVLPRDDRFAGSGPWVMLNESGALLAVYAAHRNDTVKPDVVVAPVEGTAVTPPDETADSPVEVSSPAPPSSVQSIDR